MSDENADRTTYTIDEPAGVAIDVAEFGFGDEHAFQPPLQIV